MANGEKLGETGDETVGRSRQTIHFFLSNPAGAGKVLVTLLHLYYMYYE